MKHQKCPTAFLAHCKFLDSLWDANGAVTSNSAYVKLSADVLWAVFGLERGPLTNKEATAAKSEGTG